TVDVDDFPSDCHAFAQRARSLMAGSGRMVAPPPSLLSAKNLSAMPAFIVPVAALLLGSAFLTLASGLHGLILPVRGHIEGFSAGELGLVGAGWAIGFIGGCLVIPAAVRNV